MTIDTYGLSEEQYTEFFEDNMRFACKLYLQAVNIATAEHIANVDFKTLRDLYEESVYATNDDCRKYQKKNDPDAIKENDLYDLHPTREDMMKEIQSVNAKVEALTNCFSNLISAVEKTS